MKHETPLVSIIIVCWNSGKYIVDCLCSIGHYSTAASCEVIVVDNGSSDGTPNLVREHFPEVDLVQTGSNLGFPRANNLALRRAKGDYLFLLNPDTSFKSDVVGVLTAFLDKNPEAGAVCPKIIEKDGSVSLFAIRELPSLLDSFFIEFGLRKCFPKSALFARGFRLDWDGDTPLEVPFIAGAALMIRREVLEETGLLDERLPMYFEDLDMSARIRKTGRLLFVVPAAVVRHLGGQSTELSPVRPLLFALENGQAPWLYMKTYYSGVHATAFTIIILVGNILRLAAIPAMFLRSVFDDDYSQKARRQATKSVALLKWAFSNKKTFADRLSHVFSPAEQISPPWETT